MARRSEKSKARKSPEKSPRRVGRPSRRRKKSDSESSEDKKATEPAEVEQGESSESGRLRRTRRQAEPSTSESKPPAVEWKEDETFWSKDDENNKTEVSQGDIASVWKVQTSNGSGGEIQKLRICRQRPSGTGSDSAESSMSPAKDMSPLHRRVLRKDSQKSPLVESSVAEIDLPSVEESSLDQESSGMSHPPNQVNELEPPPADSQVKEPESVPDQSVEEPVSEPPVQQKRQSEDKPSEEPPVNKQVNELEPPPADSQVKEPESVPDQSVEEPVSEPPNTVQQKRQRAEKPSEEPPVNKQSEEPAKSKVKIPGLLEEKEKDKVADSQKRAISEDKSPQKDGIPTTDGTPATDDNATVTKHCEDKNENKELVADNKNIGGATEPDESKSPDDRAPLERRRKSDSSVKSGGSRRSSISGPTSAYSEYNEPVLEINVNKSPLHDGKEEGEIVEDEKTVTTDKKEKRRVLTIKIKSEDSTPTKILVNRRTSEENSSSTTTSKPGSTPGAGATTAKKHPLITGPEPDDSPAVRRRKLSALSTSRTVITTGGTTRPVRSIPGEALKAVLHADQEKKDKEKRPKVIKHKEEKTEGGGDEIKSHEAKLNIVEDFREILKNNRANEKKLAATAEKETKSTKSPSRTVTIAEVKAPVRKVSIGVAPSVEEVKTSKPARSKSPGDSKATPILFITNLVRPFTANQLKELLARTGTIVANGFFIDKIKSKCFVKYADVEMAIETRHALNGVRWPVSNPKVLKVSYAADKELKVIQDSAEGEVVDDISTPRANSGSGWLSSEQAVVKEKEKKKASGPSTREWDRGKTKTAVDEDVTLKFRPEVLADLKLLKLKYNFKKSLKDEHPQIHLEKHREKDKEKRKRRSPIDMENTSPPPARKFKKKDYDAPAKLLDDLFRKTKTTPCLYWLPLSAEQIAEKEEARRKHMAEHDRRFAELKKSAQQRRDKERERDRDRRRK